jgi:hypothetical protein
LRKLCFPKKLITKKSGEIENTDKNNESESEYDETESEDDESESKDEDDENENEDQLAKIENADENDGSENKDQLAKIEKYIDALNEMEELIVVFDAIEQSDNLEDAIASAILKSIKYRVENFEQFFRSETRSAELEWCLVRSFVFDEE